MRRFSIPPLKPSGTVNVVFDGNSLVAGTGAATTPLPAAFASLLPGLASVSNLGGAGRTWRMMSGLDGGSANAVDAAFNASRTNVLFAWETTNSVCNAGRTAAQTIQDAADYIAARRAAHPGWRIVLLTSVPRQTGNAIFDLTTRMAANQAMTSVDMAFLGNYRAMGADAVVDLRRKGSYFRFGDFDDAAFASDPSGFWYEAAPGRVHLVDNAYMLIADWCREAFRRIHRR